MKIILIGYMGSGKSMVGNELAQTLSADFIDLDAKIEKEEGMPISKLFDDKGEIYFRKKERTTLLSLLEPEGTVVIATGGGTPCYGNIMQEVLDTPNVKTIYLKASIDTLTERLFQEKAKRPLIAHLAIKEDLNDFIRKHLFERNFYYFQAEKTVSVDNKTVTSIVEELVVELF